jgi:hypothetical protein
VNKKQFMLGECLETILSDAEFTSMRIARRRSGWMLDSMPSLKLEDFVLLV